MLELVATRACVIGCHAEAAALDRLDGALRIAPDEAMIVASPGSAAPVVAALAARVAVDDAHALVLDATDGWTIWTLRGDPVRAAFSYLSELELPEEGFTQGEVADIPMKVVVVGDRIHLLAPAMWDAYVRERILTGCEPLEIREAEEPVGWEGTS